MSFFKFCNLENFVHVNIKMENNRLCVRQVEVILPDCKLSIVH
jgi:hypothetical protein